MARTLRALLVIALVLAAPTAACAQTTPVAPASTPAFAAPLGYPGETLAKDPQLTELANLAVRSWTGVAPEACPDGVSVYLADDLGAADDQGESASGLGGSCVIAFRRDAIGRLEGDLSRRMPRTQRIVLLGFLCADVDHETGHAMGLPHAPSGVMMAGVGPTPPACQAWAVAHAGPRSYRHRSERRTLKRHKGRILGLSVG